MPPALAQWPQFYSQLASMTHVCFLLSLTYLCCATSVCVCVCVFVRERRGEESSICATRKCVRKVAGNQVVSYQLWLELRDDLQAVESTPTTRVTCFQYEKSLTSTVGSTETTETPISKSNFTLG